MKKTENLKTKITQCIWLREDLRTQDHEGFREAQKNYPNQACLAVYILTPKTWLDHDRSPQQIYFILENLKKISESLSLVNIPLKILNLNTFEDIPQSLLNFCQTYGVETIYASQTYGLDELNRDKNTAEFLKNFNIQIQFRNDFVFFAPDKIIKSDGKPYQIFTAYKKIWIEKILNTSTPSEDLIFKSHYRLKPQAPTGISSDHIPDKINAFEFHPIAYQNQLFFLKNWVLSEEDLIKKLKKFIQTDLDHYAQNRNFPALNKTSLLSPYLAIGLINIRTILSLLIQERSCGNWIDLFNQEGPASFITELIWRDFYQMILFFFPRVSKHEPYLLETKQIKWSEDTALFKAWCEGQTGFPIIDASMRCLNQTGFLHNRLRMIVAMFLSKLLWIDWRWGEAYFMKNLIDGELGANNGGWQWCASTGTDSVPYFRIFNPLLQSQKFDPEGSFIRSYVPELQNLNRKEIHNPDLFTRKKLGYPEPIIDYSKQRKHAIEAFKKIQTIKK